MANPVTSSLHPSVREFHESLKALWRGSLTFTKRFQEVVSISPAAAMEDLQRSLDAIAFHKVAIALDDWILTSEPDPESVRAHIREQAMRVLRERLTRAKDADRTFLLCQAEAWSLMDHHAQLAGLP